MTDIDRFIAALACELYDDAQQYGPVATDIKIVLERRLKPMLEAGELMRPYFHYKNPAAEAWDLAIKKLAEESGK